MLTMWRNFLHAFLYDEQAFKRWIRGGLNAAATIGAQLVIDPAWTTWTCKQWLVHMIPPALAFVAGSVTYGDRTPANVKNLANELTIDRAGKE